MDVTALTTRFLDHVDDPNQDIWNSAAKIVRFLNAAQRAIHNELLKRSDLVLATSTAIAVTATNYDEEYSLPSGVERVHMVEKVVSGSNPVPLVGVEFADRHRAEYAGNACAYYIRAAKIGFPTPLGTSWTATVHYSTLPTDLTTTGADVPSIPARHHELLAIEAARQAKASVGEELNRTASETFAREWGALMTDVNRRMEGTPRYIHYVEESTG